MILFFYLALYKRSQMVYSRSQGSKGQKRSHISRKCTLRSRYIYILFAGRVDNIYYINNIYYVRHIIYIESINILYINILYICVKYERK